jgi:hypothetical protein
MSTAPHSHCHNEIDKGKTGTELSTLDGARRCVDERRPTLYSRLPGRGMAGVFLTELAPVAEPSADLAGFLAQRQQRVAEEREAAARSAAVSRALADTDVRRAAFADPSVRRVCLRRRGCVGTRCGSMRRAVLCCGVE